MMMPATIYLGLITYCLLAMDWLLWFLYQAYEVSAIKPIYRRWTKTLELSQVT